MLIGIDFDNTIVCYDRLFHTLALERGLIPPELPATKTSVRNYLIEQGREESWTELQGIAYGPEISRAEVFPGVLEFFCEAHRRGLSVAIISHKSRHPFRGEKHDLHGAARRLLRDKGFFAPATGLTEADIFFELTKEEKLARIASRGCTHFIDDLPELLNEPTFPTDVRKILFDPQRACADESGRVRIGNWRDVIDVVTASWSVRLAPEPDAIAQLLRAAQLSSTGYELTPLAGGRNNRTFRLTTRDRRAFLLKAYFHHPDDSRDRLGAEYAFASFCRRQAIDAAPAPLARDDDARLGLYAFIAGKKLAANAIDQDHIAAALAFVHALQANRDAPEAAILPTASEACFSVDEHRHCIIRRIDRLVHAALGRHLSDPFRCFILDRLFPAWDKIDDRILAKMPLGSAALERPLSLDERCLSPSDFGFHNAIEGPDGRLRFFDFEYAGWDDPAKLVCDFFCQVDIPAPLGFARWFATQLSADFRNPHALLARTDLLFPAYRIKWCTIVLNDFLLTGAARRAFGGNAPSAERLESQLASAAKILDQLALEND